MEKTDPKIVAQLNSDYTNFVNSVMFREGEDFYREGNSIFELSYNENPLGCGSKAREVLVKHADFSHRYPPLGYSVLIEEIARHWDISTENILVTPGSVAAIYLTMAQYSNTGDKVLYSKSSIPWYRWSAASSGSTTVEVPLSSNMGHDLSAFLRAIDETTSVVVISNPHNPTGIYIQESDLVRFLRQIPESTLLIIDQAYYEYQSKQERLLIDIVNETTNLLITRTFSKIHGLAGLRIGYSISNNEIRQAIRSKWLGFMPSIGSAACFAAYQALLDEKHVLESKEFNLRSKNSIYSIARKYGLQYIESEVNFVLVNIYDSKINQQFFIENDIAFTPGLFFGYPEWARISFDVRLTELVDKLDSVFESIVKDKR